ncbi:hypothetical protein [Cryobacterium sp. PH29-G1]|uniref:hypothetical protein n=1 Tax=Cryobacterium sp. PH29-G1 TaxID=3046211 RepID=UPI0024B9523F|nr:hypothetical protein [Cryobacterium sp. PH29-G1]MDJ0347844.1 hypothetical protein [Cryobacterium sp. PH29-G1]
MTIPPDSSALAAQLLAIPGVAEIFPPSPPIVQLSTAAAGLLTRSPIRADLVEVKQTSGGTRITAKIAATADQPARETGRRVVDSLLAAAEPGAEVTVQIVRVS